MNRIPPYISECTPIIFGVTELRCYSDFDWLKPIARKKTSYVSGRVYFKESEGQLSHCISMNEGIDKRGLVLDSSVVFVTL